ncbi:putative transmembrane protein [Crotalus adamanteus]|uniref:Transmembrane protein n=1 Tax=Crotalus adamanteus TaxID=8729 RepID=A0AAW1BIH0_CROAD
MCSDHARVTGKAREAGDGYRPGPAQPSAQEHQHHRHHSHQQRRRGHPHPRRHPSLRGEPGAPPPSVHARGAVEPGCGAPVAVEPAGAARSRNMSSRPTGGSGSGVCFGPRDTDKPFADSERAQKWRLSLASLLFFTVLLSDHLWLCVEARQVAAGRHRDRERRAEPGMEHDVGGTAPSSSPAAPATGQCFSLLGDAEAACRRLQPGGSAQAELYLPFCNSYTLRELFAGLSRPDTLNCTVDHGEDHEDDDWGAGEGDRRSREEDWLRSCRRCVLVYQRYDRQAQDRYREFELVLQKYLQAEEYSVKSGPEDCKTLDLFAWGWNAAWQGKVAACQRAGSKVMVCDFGCFPELARKRRHSEVSGPE